MFSSLSLDDIYQEGVSKRDGNVCCISLSVSRACVFMSVEAILLTGITATTA